MTDWIVSVDDHIMEPKGLWVDRLPAKWRDIGPHVVREYVTGDGGQPASRGDPGAQLCDVWYYEDVRVPILMWWTAAGFPPEEVKDTAMTYDLMRPGAYDAQARVADMDINRVAASLGFPNLFIRFCGQRFLEAEDKNMALACVKAYNDFVVEEWQSVAPGRLFGAGIVPLWDAKLAAEEVYRVAELGIRNICFSEIPAWIGLPGLYNGYWDPLFAACEESGSVVQLHIGSSSTALTTSDDAPLTVPTANLYVNSSLALSDLLCSGVFQRYSKLEVALAESQAGWIPYLLERLDTLWRGGYAFNGSRERLEIPPSMLYEGHVYSCIFNDQVALEHLLWKIGPDSICFETDYPHPDGTFPHSLKVAQDLVKGLDSEIAEKILRTNGMRMLKLDQLTVPEPHAITA